MLNTIKEKICTFLYKGVIISLVLGFLIQTIAAFPLYAFVVNEDEIEHVELNNTNEVNEEDVRLLYEIEEYRTEHSKVFKRTDGKLEYVYYDEVVNYCKQLVKQGTLAYTYTNNSNMKGVTHINI